MKQESFNGIEILSESDFLKKIHIFRADYGYEYVNISNQTIILKYISTEFSYLDMLQYHENSIIEKSHRSIYQSDLYNFVLSKDDLYSRTMTLISAELHDMCSEYLRKNGQVPDCFVRVRISPTQYYIMLTSVNAFILYITDIKQYKTHNRDSMVFKVGGRFANVRPNEVVLSYYEKDKLYDDPSFSLTYQNDWTSFS